MSECRNLENVGQVEELLLMTEQMQDELDYDRFFNIPGGAYVDTRHKNFFGIDHVGVSVGYRIDWKGGRR